MARTNYSYEKRGRELEKQKKKEEKRLKKLAEKELKANGGEITPPPVEGEATPSSASEVASVPSQSTE